MSIATLLSQHHQVTAVDIISEKVDMINNRKSPIQDDYIEKYLAEKELNLTATLDAKTAYADADFVVIAAPTNYDSHGIYKGQTLAEVLSAHPEYLGTKVENGELPVLVKFIDAKKDLSVQVHPDDAYAREHEGDNGKTEMWYVVDADEGAHLIYGKKK